ncbi:MAG: pirin family protein [Oscillatoriales cyanobacterium SM2_2_1]|nr:pirin family protein [Oscillatoriales cyanobacterium SM2_2_1]
MITLRPSQKRGHARIDWLDSYHTFSFASYYDPQHMGFGTLRVINEDRIAPSAGFAPHGHSDMEIITYVLDGALEHRDSLGNGSVIHPGDVQRMSAGTGIRHSEYNPSSSNWGHLLQIWILPAQQGTQPSYEQTHFPREQKYGQLCLVGSSDGRHGSVTIQQDVDLYCAIVPPGERLSHGTSLDRKLWLQVVRGGLSVCGQQVGTGDGVAIAETSHLEVIGGAAESEFLLFDMG